MNDRDLGPTILVMSWWRIMITDQVHRSGLRILIHVTEPETRMRIAIRDKDKGQGGAGSKYRYTSCLSCVQICSWGLWVKRFTLGCGLHCSPWILIQSLTGPAAACLINFSQLSMIALVKNQNQLLLPPSYLLLPHLTQSGQIGIGQFIAVPDSPIIGAKNIMEGVNWAHYF